MLQSFHIPKRCFNLKKDQGLPWWLSNEKHLPANSGDMGPSPDLGRCQGITKPVCHNSWPSTPEPVSHNYWAHMHQLLKPKNPRACALQQQRLKQWEALTPQLESSPRSLQLEKSLCSSEDSAQTKNKINQLNYFLKRPFHAVEKKIGTSG